MFDDVTGRPAAMDRRSFLRGSSLFAAALGLTALAPLTALAQTQPPPTGEQQKKEGDKKEPEKKPDPPKGEGDKKEGTPEKPDQKPQEKQQEREKESEKDKKDEPKKEDRQEPKKEVLRDTEGREYRVCPQCGSNMYKQGRVWSCDNCGYSYVE